MRQFTCIAETKCQILSFSVEDLNRMRMEFLDSFDELFNVAQASV